MPNDRNLTRRDFLRTSAIGVAGAAGASSLLAGANASSPSPSPLLSSKKRYAIVGTGGRHYMYHDAILGRFAETSELVGLCDINPGRVKLSQDGPGPRPAGRSPDTPPPTSTR